MMMIMMMMMMAISIVRSVKRCGLWFFHSLVRKVVTFLRQNYEGRKGGREENKKNKTTFLIPEAATAAKETEATTGSCCVFQ